MSVQQIEEAVRSLTDEELAEFRRWFEEYDAAVWDREFVEDVRTGKLDAVADHSPSARP
jgi:hypothetical protein